MKGRFQLKTEAFHMVFLLEAEVEKSSILDLDSVYTILPADIVEDEEKITILTVGFMDAAQIERMELSMKDGRLYCRGSIADYGYMEGYAEPYTGLTPCEDMTRTLKGERPRRIRRTDAEIAECVEELLRQMSIEEKIGQMEQSAGMDVSEIGMELEAKPMLEQIRLGEIGSLIYIGCSPETIFAYQKLSVENSRLKIPQMVCQDVVHGFQTIVPVPLAQSCSFDEELVKKAARRAAREASAAGIQCAFAPMVDVARDARWGRNVEGFGEDPYLAGVMCRAVVNGYQGEGLGEDGTVAACLKHFVGYSAVEGGRDYNTVEISDHILHNTYLPPFMEGIRQGAAMVMSSFNVMDGIPVSANKHILRDILRGELGFQGATITDYAAVKEVGVHGCCGEPREIAEKVAKAGIDIEMATSFYNFYLKTLVNEGKLDEKVIDDSVRRILALKYKLGIMDDPYCNIRAEELKDLILCEEHMETAEKLAEESTVLLKNDGLLPLDKSKKLAVIGPHASEKDLLGPWQFSNYPQETVSFLQGLEEEGYSCLTEKGCEIHDEIPGGIERAVEKAKQADVIVLCLGEASNMSGEATSRLHITIPDVQLKLLDALKETKKPILLLLVNGRPLVLTDVEQKVNAIFETWFPGHRGGKAAAGLISGRVNPSGKLTISFPAGETQVPVYYNYYNTGRPCTGDDDRFTSRYLDGENMPLYTFGDGLSYSEFRLTGMKLDKKELVSGGRITVTAGVENCSDRDGTAILQMYIRDDYASAVRPVKELKGFQRVPLMAGETKNVVFTISEETIRFYTAEKRWEAEPGSFTVWVGFSSRGRELLEDTFHYTLAKEISLSERNII